MIRHLIETRLNCHIAAMSYRHRQKQMLRHKWQRRIWFIQIFIIPMFLAAAACLIMWGGYIPKKPPMSLKTWAFIPMQSTALVLGDISGGMVAFGMSVVITVAYVIVCGN